MALQARDKAAADFAVAIREIADIRAARAREAHRTLSAQFQDDYSHGMHEGDSSLALLAEATR